MASGRTEAEELMCKICPKVILVSRGDINCCTRLASSSRAEATKQLDCS